jgi:hypothetical protein
VPLFGEDFMHEHSNTKKIVMAAGAGAVLAAVGFALYWHMKEHRQ